MDQPRGGAVVKAPDKNEGGPKRRAALNIVDRVRWGKEVAAYNKYTKEDGSIGRAPATLLAVAFALVYRGNSKTGQLNPSLDIIADDVGIGRSSVIRAVKMLTNSKFLTRIRGGGRHSNQYTLTFRASVVVSAVTPQDSRSGVKDDTAPVSAETCSGISDDTRTGKNREKEQGEAPCGAKSPPKKQVTKAMSPALKSLLRPKGRRYTRELDMETELLPVCAELGIDTRGRNERELRSSLESAVERLRAGERLESLAEKRGDTGGSSDGNHWQHTLLKRLAMDLGEEAEPRLRKRCEIYGKACVDAAAVSTLNELNFHEALTARLGEQKELASQPTEETP